MSLSTLLSWGSSAWSFVSGLSGASWVKWALVAALAGLLTLLWFDYQGAKDDAARYAERLETAQLQLEDLADLARANTKAALAREARLKADLELSARISAHRQEALRTLADQVELLQTYTRPEDEKDCPLHPALVAAFDMLRDAERTATVGGRGPGKDRVHAPPRGDADLQPGPASPE